MNIKLNKNNLIEIISIPLNPTIDLKSFFYKLIEVKYNPEAIPGIATDPIKNQAKNPIQIV